MNSTGPTAPAHVERIELRSEAACLEGLRRIIRIFGVNESRSLVKGIVCIPI
jgi:hypothetical protein